MAKKRQKNEPRTRATRQQPKRLSDQLRQILKDSPVSSYRLWKLTDIPQSSLSRFRHGEASLSLQSVDELGLVLGLELVARGEVDLSVRKES